MDTGTNQAEIYSKFRRGITPEVVSAIMSAANRDKPAERLLDLGTGTGQSIEAFFGQVHDIIAVEPNTQRLQFARQRLEGQAQQQGATIQFLDAHAEDFTVPQGWQASIATICRAFHVMDRPTVLRHLETIVAQEGVVAIIDDLPLWSSGNAPWQQELAKYVKQLIDAEHRLDDGEYKDPSVPYADLFKTSIFPDISEQTIPYTRTWTVDEIVGYIQSTAFGNPDLFGEHAADFARDFAATLQPLSPTGTFEESGQFKLLIGRRP